MAVKLHSLTRASRETFSSLRHENYRAYFFSQLISLLGIWGQLTAVSYLLFDLTKSAAYLGYYGFASGIPVWIFTFYGGVIADRLPKRTLIIFTQSGRMMLAFVLFGLTASGIIQPWHILVHGFFLGLVKAADIPARQAFIVELVERKDITNAIALKSVMLNTAATFGSGLAGVAYSLWGPEWIFLYNGISFFFIIFSLSRMKIEDKLVATTPAVSAFGQIKEGVNYVISNEVVRTLIFSLVFYIMFGFSITKLMPAWAVNVLNGDANTNGILLAARGVGSVVAALMIAFLSRQRVRGKIWFIGTFFFPAILLTMALIQTTSISILMLIGMGFSLMSLSNTTNAMVQTAVPDELRGRVMSLYTVTFQGGLTLGAPLVGLMADAFSEPTAVVICSIILFGVAGFLLFRRPAMRRLA